MAIYPNPSDGNFKVLLEYPNIGAPQVSIRITDMNGRLIYVREINEKDEFVRIEESFEMSSFLQDGIYAVMLGGRYKINWQAGYLSRVNLSISSQHTICIPGSSVSHIM